MAAAARWERLGGSVLVLLAVLAGPRTGWCIEGEGAKAARVPCGGGARVALAVLRAVPHGAKGGSVEQLASCVQWERRSMHPRQATRHTTTCASSGTNSPGESVGRAVTLT